MRISAGALELPELQKRRQLVNSKIEMLNREQELLRKIAADKKKETDIKASLAGICRRRCDQPQANFIREQTETLADRLGQGLNQRVAGGCVLQHPAPEAHSNAKRKSVNPIRFAFHM
jgi:hypothetical protein